MYALWFASDRSHKVAKDQMELEIMRVHGLTDKTDNKGSVWIKYDLGYSKDEKIGGKYRDLAFKKTKQNKTKHKCFGGVFGGGSFLLIAYYFRVSGKLHPKNSEPTERDMV